MPFFTHDPIPNVLSDNDLKVINRAYDDAPEHDYRLAWEFGQFVQGVALEEIAYAKQNYGLRGVEYVAGQPYATADEMRQRVRREHVLYISTDYDNDPFLQGNNLAFRTAHDLHHIRSSHCNFELWGEICAYTKFAAWTTNPVYHNILFSEIVAQVVALRLRGDYAEQRLGIQPQALVNQVHRAYDPAGKVLPYAELFIVE